MPELARTFTSKAAEYWAKKRRRKNAAGRQAHRALPTNSMRWRRLRAQVLAADPLCVRCLSRGNTTAATEVDHINNDATDNRLKNLQALCKPCHSRKTANEQNRECGRF